MYLLRTDSLSTVSSAISHTLPPDYLGGGSPEILSAYLEVENFMAEVVLSESRKASCADHQPLKRPLHMFADDALGDFLVLEGVYRERIQSRGGVGNDLFANLGNTIAQRAVYIAALTNDNTALQKSFISLNSLGVDIVLAGLECLPGVWASKTSPVELSGVAKTYMSLLNISTSPEVRSVTLTLLKDVLQNRFEEFEVGGNLSTNEKLNNILGFSHMDLGSTVLIDYNTPSLENAEIAISGFVMLSDYASHISGILELDSYNNRLSTWGHYLCVAGEVANVSDAISFLRAHLTRAGL